jgi:ureidoacrylate peracid hydrolase
VDRIGIGCRSIRKKGEGILSQSTEDFEAAARLSHVRPFANLREKIDPSRAALIVIDVQNDFCAIGGMMSNEGFDVSEAQKMAERLPTLIAAARAAGVLVVFVRNIYSTQAAFAPAGVNRPPNMYLSDSWLEQAARTRKGSYTRREVCTEGSWEADFYGKVLPLPGEPIVTKHRYSAFHNTDLDSILRSHGIRTIVLTGVATNVCVETTAREGFVRDYYVVFTADGTATYSTEDHKATLRNIDRFFGEVTTIDDLMAVWGS